ncbi:MAG TPA: class I SAM-dependent RNA methyltransferase [Bacteroidia bacterium]|nr:class I SAM-dependent RNA methyltransferase [Bacteroidia bacterium]
MADFNTKGTIVVTCYPYLSEYLAQELNSLGFSECIAGPTSVSITGTLYDCIALNVNLRTASRVLFTLWSSPCSDLQNLYQQITDYNWENYVAKSGYFSITSSARHPEVKNTMYLNMRVKDAIADRFMRLYNVRPDSGSAKSGVSVHILWKDNTVTVSIDTSGESLSKHGYRLHPGKAPLQECIGAGLILASKWDRKSTFINPMCGSGTLAIEAALMVKRIPPGSFRTEYAFKHLIGFENKMYEQIVEKIPKDYLNADKPIIIASDINPDYIEAAKANAEIAGVADMIQFECCDFAETAVPEGGGIVIINPPYGERLGEIDDLLLLYKRIGEFFKKKCGGKFGFVLTSEKELAAQIGLKASARIPIMNADIECRLLKYELYAGSRKKVNPDS